MTKAIVFDYEGQKNLQEEFENCKKAFFNMITKDDPWAYMIAVNVCDSSKSIVIMESYLETADDGEPTPMIHYNGEWLREHNIKF